MAYDKFKNITMQQLEALIHLVDERSFSRAAKKMYLTQPSLTKHIKNLEEAVDAKVVNRKNTGVTLTPEGRILYDYGRRIFKLVDEAKERIVRVRDDESGSIFISASTIPSTYILPHVFQAFHARYPDIRCYVQMNDSDATINMVMDDQAEIGFVGRCVSSKKVYEEPVWKDRLILVVPEGHRWSRKDMVTIDELTAEAFIIREKGSATRAVFEEYLKEHSKVTLSEFTVVTEMGSSEAVKEAILAGLGVSVISVHAVKRELRNGHLVEVPLENCTIERNFYLIYKRKFNVLRHHELFLKYVRGTGLEFTV